MYSVLFSAGYWVTKAHGLQTRACGLWKSVQLPECPTGGTCFCLSVAGTKSHLCGWQAEVRHPCVLAQVSALSCVCSLWDNEYELPNVGSISSHVTHSSFPWESFCFFRPNMVKQSSQSSSKTSWPLWQQQSECGLTADVLNNPFLHWCAMSLPVFHLLFQSP